MTIIDTAQVVALTLRTFPDLVSEVTDGQGVHIYGPPGIPTGFELRKAVIYLSNGGQPDTEIPIDREVFQFTCYGKTSQEARSVYRKLRAALHRFGHTRIAVGGQVALVQYVRMVGGPTDMEEPELGWPFVYCTFQWQMIESYVA